MSFDHVQLKNALLGRLSKAEPAEAWRELLAAGVLGLRAPEAQGGLGLAFADASSLAIAPFPAWQAAMSAVMPFGV